MPLMMTLAELDRLSPPDWENGAVQDEIRNSLKLLEANQTAARRMNSAMVAAFDGMKPRDPDVKAAFQLLEKIATGEPPCR